MSWFTRLGRALGFDRRMNERIDAEMAFHLEMKTAENIAAGMSPQAAARAARLAFGNPTLQAEATREARTVLWLEHLSRDLRVGVRSLRRRPGMALTAILSLALGIGGTTAVFTLLDAVALKPLPYPDLDRIYAIVETVGGETSNGNPLRNRDFAAQVSSFAAVAGYYGETQVLSGRGDPERVRLRLGVGDYLGVFGPNPSLGRGFTPAEQAGEPVLVVRERAATRWFGSAAAAIGQSVVLDQIGYTVIGVAPDEAEPRTVDGWAPAARDVQETSRRAGFLSTAAKLKPGVTAEVAAAELALVQKRLGREYPDTDADRVSQLVGLQDVMVGDLKAGGLVVLGIAGAVLLAACFNVASLLLGRTSERRRESAVRTALGAGTGSLVRLYLGESLLLAIAGGSLGVAIAMIVVPAVRSLDLPIELPRVTTAAVDARTLLFALGLVVVATLVFGTLPALRAARGVGQVPLNRGAPRSLTQDLLVVGQTAVALLLVMAAATLAEGFLRLRRAPLGFVSEGLVTANVDLSWNTPRADLVDFRTRALEALGAIPGVTAVAVVDRLPLSGGSQSGPVSVVGRTLPPDLENSSVSFRAIAGDYFTAMGIPMIQGGPPRDPGSAVATESFARRWLGDRPIGQRVIGRDKQQFLVVGVVPDVRQSVADERPVPAIYIRADDTYWPELAFVVRSAQPVGALAPVLRRRIATLGSDRVVESIRTMDDHLAGAAQSPKLLTWLFGGFAAVALVIVAIGLFGVLSGYVASRTSEMGVRIALGATPTAMMRRVTRRGMLLSVIGIGLGIVASLVSGGVLARFPISLTPNQPVLLVVASLAFLGLSVIVGLVPAVRAARVDPAIVLRHE